MEKAKTRRILPIIFLTVLLDLVSISILIPVLPSLFANPDSPVYLLAPGTPVSNGYIILGLLIGAWPLAQFFVSPVMGELSDMYGRKKIIAVSLAGVCLAHILFSWGILVHSLTVLFAARILGGVTGSNLVVAQAAIADITPEKDRAKNFALIGAAYGLGFIVGPVIGGLLVDHELFSWSGVLTPFLVAAALQVVNVLAVLIVMPETRELPETVRKPSWFKAVTHIYSAYAMKDLRAVFATNFFFQAGFSFFATFLGVYLIYRFGFDEKDIGLYLAYGGVCIALAQGFLVRYISARWSDISILRWSLFLGAIATMAYYFPHTAFGLALIVPLFAATNGLSMAHLPALVSKRASKETQGEMLGINMSLQSLAYAIPPILSGFIAAELTPEAPIYVAGVIIFVAWLVFVVGVRK